MHTVPNQNLVYGSSFSSRKIMLGFVIKISLIEESLLLRIKISTIEWDEILVTCHFCHEILVIQSKKATKIFFRSYSYDNTFEEIQ